MLLIVGQKNLVVNYKGPLAGPFIFLRDIMIKEFNISDSKVVNLRGDHYAKTVFCKSLVKHEGDVYYAWLHCDKVIELGDEFLVELVEPSNCDDEDRIYKGELHIRGIYGKDEQRPPEIEEPEEIPVGYLTTNE